jgi:outer membrane murein-binding lipoprotein Lpp
MEAKLDKLADKVEALAVKLASIDVKRDKTNNQKGII